MHKHILEEMKRRSSKEDLMCAIDQLGMVLDTIKETHHDFYKHIETNLYENLYGKVMSEEMARKTIEKMRPYGMKWTLSETSDLLKAHNWSISPIDFWIVMNSAYNDYREMFDEDVEEYAKYAKLFIKDDDAKDGKVYTYFMNIPK